MEKDLPDSHVARMTRVGAFVRDKDGGGATQGPLADAYYAGMREAVSTLAHMTSTPAALAHSSLAEVLGEGGWPGMKISGKVRQKLQRAFHRLGEVNEADQRALLFDYKSKTLLDVSADVGHYFSHAVQQAGMEYTGHIPEEARVYANPFRLFFALRDLLVCARMVHAQSSCAVACEEEQLSISIVIPADLPSPHSVDDTGALVQVDDEDDLTYIFHPSYFIMVGNNNFPKHQGKPFPFNISLKLAHFLIREMGGEIEAQRTGGRDGSQKQVCITVRLPLYQERR